MRSRGCIISVNYTERFSTLPVLCAGADNAAQPTLVLSTPPPLTLSNIAALLDLAVNLAALCLCRTSCLQQPLLFNKLPLLQTVQKAVTQSVVQ